MSVHDELLATRRPAGRGDAARGLRARGGDPRRFRPHFDRLELRLALSGQWLQTSAADFGAGAQSSTAVTNSAGGEVQLAPSFADDFSGTAVGSAWTTNSYSTSARYGDSGGVLSVSGGAIYSASTFLGVPVEARLSIGAASYQHFGLATGLGSVAGNSWALFSTMGTSTTLYARVNSNGSTSDVSLGALPSGYHAYRISPASGGYQFLVDGALRATVSRSTPSGLAMKVTVSSLTPSTSTPVLADWVRVANYPSSGTFTSSSFDATQAATWGVASWTATAPSGTSVLVDTSSSGDGATWSAWAPASNGGPVSSPSGRFLRYRARLATSNAAATAVLSDLAVNFTTGTADTTAPTVTSRTPAATGGVSASASVSATFSEAVQPSTVVLALTGPTGVAVAGSASYNAATNTATLTPSAALAASTTYTATLGGARDLAGNPLAAAVSWSFTTAAVVTVSTGASTEPLLTQSNLQYVGAFRLPTGQIGSSTFNYGGTAITFNPANNSLFIVGHPYDQSVAEVAIPSSIVNSSNLGNMATAKVLQPFSSVLSRLPNNPSDLSTGGTEAIGGLMVVNNQLIATAYNTYDGNAAVTLSHFKLSSLNLGTAGVSGLYQVGNLGGGFVGGSMAPVPAEWRSALGSSYLTGQAALNVITRTSYGPSAFGFDPTGLASGVNPDTPYVYYDQNHTTLGAWDSNPATLFNGTVGGGNVTGFGMAFVPGTRTVLFISSIGKGNFYYGEAAGANDSNRTSKGVHSVGGNYAYQVWAYDANDFVAVKNGQKNPWDLKPYTTWNFDFPVVEGSKLLGGVAFDPSTGRLYVSQLSADPADPYTWNPLIQVFQVTPYAAPSAGPQAATQPSTAPAAAIATVAAKPAASPAPGIEAAPALVDDTVPVPTAEAAPTPSRQVAPPARSPNLTHSIAQGGMAARFSKWYQAKKPVAGQE